MATETTFSRRWKRPSPAFLLVIIITVAGLAIAFALPRLVLPRFANQPVTLVFQVRVTDNQGAPIPQANVSIGKASAQTDADGYADLRRTFLARGIMGVSGACALEGELRVGAPGHIPWRAPLPHLFGRNYNYVDKGTIVPHEVTLFR